jgi:hypothetical protein
MNILRRKQLDRYRVFLHAAHAWRAGYPHQAWEIINRAGLAKHWPSFQAAVIAQARTRFRTAIEAVERIYV